jgi:hypothetical protein
MYEQISYKPGLPMSKQVERRIGELRQIREIDLAVGDITSSKLIKDMIRDAIRDSYPNSLSINDISQLTGLATRQISGNIYFLTHKSKYNPIPRVSQMYSVDRSGLFTWVPDGIKDAPVVGQSNKNPISKRVMDVLRSYDHPIGQDLIAERTGLSRQVIRSALERLTVKNEVKHIGSRGKRLWTVADNIDKLHKPVVTTEAVEAMTMSDRFTIVTFIQDRLVIKDNITDEIYVAEKAQVVTQVVTIVKTSDGKTIEL